MSIRKRCWKKKTFFSVFFIFDLSGILENLHKCAIGMLNAGMTIVADAMNIGCSTHAIRHLWQNFQATGRLEDRPRSGCLCVMTNGQDRYILNTHLRNRFQTAKLLLLTPLVHITTIYLPKLCVIACARVGYVYVGHMMVVF